MVFSNKKQGQSLPLNTIVIAILVIIVLLVIVVFFTSSIGKSGEQIDNAGVTDCVLSNPVIQSLGYDEVHKELYDEQIPDCSNGQKISSVPNWKEGETDYMCCGTK